MRNLLILFSSALVFAQPPRNVRVSVNEVPRTVTGRITVSWTPAGPADSYDVVVAPLAYKDMLADPVNSGFTFFPGGAFSTAAPAGGGGVLLSSHAGHQLASNGRGQWPLALTKPPDNTTVRAELDCSTMSAPAAAYGGQVLGFVCGVVVFDAGSNSTLLMAGLVMRGSALSAEVVAPGFKSGSVSSFSKDGTVLSSSRTMNGGEAWNLAKPIFISLQTTASGWIFVISPLNSMEAVTIGALRSELPKKPWGAPADWWVGVTAGAFGGDPGAVPPGGKTVSARLTSWEATTNLPMTPPTTLLGFRDVCFSPGGGRGAS